MRSLLTAALVLAATAAQADDLVAPPPSIALPGWVNVSIGTVAPSEPGNVLTSIAAEQGFTVWQHGSLFVVGFVDVGVRHDTQGLAWNRRMPLIGGAKVVLARQSGVFQAVAGVASEMPRGQRAAAAPAAYVSYWTGWRGDALAAGARFAPRAFPGQLYAASGIQTAAEPRNWTSSVSVQQGVTVARPAGVSVVPFVAAALSHDTARYGWNNRTQAEAGLKLTHAILGGVVEAGVSRRRDHLRLSGDTHTGTSVFVNLWIGWTPRVSRH